MNEMRKLRTVLTGLGRIAWSFHLPAIIKNSGFELTAVSDVMPERVAETMKQFGITSGYDSFEEMLGKEKPDLVVITSPTRFHAEQAITAFRHNADVFCDKPMAFSYAEAKEILKAMKKYKRKFMTYQPHRGTMEFIALKHILSLELIGRIQLIKRTSSGYSRRNDWQALKKHGGGMLNNYGAHFIDQLMLLSSSKVTKAFCIMRNLVTAGDAEDFVKAFMETENGIMLDLEINMASAHSMPPWQINGEYGSIVLDAENKRWHVRYAEHDQFEKIKMQDGLAAMNRSYGNGMEINWLEKAFDIAVFPAVDYYAECYEYFALNKNPFVPVEETMEVMRVIELCRKCEILQWQNRSGN